ncbi:MAG: galactose-1-phosphate uridylyltransferase [Candidatus Woesearchaeota archaeon]|nr:galactose-1-phosphate uridylyltransferase [Candidatus Woesearchaeota archaeon]
MGELRKDYILDRYVIIATERAKRPHEFTSTSEKIIEKTCFFCPGSENLTPKEIMRIGKENWDIRVFPNKFAAVKAAGNPTVRTDNDFYTFSDAYGNHEVIVETPNHDKSLADLSIPQIADVFRVFKTRIEENLKDPQIRYVSVFKNHGKGAGTSIQHTHCQLVAYNILPEIIRQKEEKVKLHKDCPYCSVISRERDSLRRCFENDSFISFTPYASRFPFENWILPKRHILNLSQFEDKEFGSLAEIVKKVLMKLKELNADYNMCIQYGIENMHFHIEICPRLATWAGFELGTGTIINTMTPENAAEFYRI